MNAHKLFKKANHQWFREGRTGRAIAAYVEAASKAPQNPLVALQCARALWSAGRADEARFFVENAQQHQDRLSALARHTLGAWARRILDPQPLPVPDGFSVAQLDRDFLETLELDPATWHTLAEVAAARAMHGVAVYALGRWRGVPLDAEQARELGEIESNRDLEERALDAMLTDADRNTVPRAPRAGLHADARAHEVATAVAAPPVATPMPQASSQPAAPGVDLPDLPLRLAVRVEPGIARVGMPLQLQATLSNPTDRAVVVNSRLLINHPQQGGEIWLRVEGPQGYRNARGFRVNPGTTPAQFYVSLQPSQSVEQSWRLHDYHSLQLPGRYTVTLIYHNEAPTTPDGRAMAIGKVIGQAQFEVTV